MGNYCCIASKHQHEQQRKKSSIKSRNASKYKDEHDYDLFDNDIKNSNLKHKQRQHKKSSLYSDITKKKSDLYNSNGIDSTSSLLLLSAASSSSATSSTTTAALDQQATSRRDNSQIINHFNKPTLNPIAAKHKSQLNSAAKFNQVLIESPLLVHKTDESEIISSQNVMKQRTDLYNINENDCENEDTMHREDANLSSSLSNVTQNTANSSAKLLLTKTVNSKKLCNRKRSSYLNQSLNETDRDLMKNYNYVGRRLIDNYDENMTESANNIQEVDEEEVNKKSSTKTTEALNLFNWKNYRSLQKSKRSIKNIEETIHSSRSIEQWLNDFSKLKLFGGDGNRKKELKQLSLNGINKIEEEVKIDTKRKLSNVGNHKLKRSRTSLDENDEKFLNEEVTTTVVCNQPANKENVDEDEEEFEIISVKESRTNHSIEDANLNQFLNEIEKISRKEKTTNGLFKLIESINQQINSSGLLLNQEKDMSLKLSQFLLPKSLANGEDIDLLKWLLTKSNFRLKLVGLSHELTYSNDRLVYGTQTITDYLLVSNQLNIKLDELDQELDEEDLDTYIDQLIGKLDSTNSRIDSNTYIKYNPLNGTLKLDKDLIEKLLNKEKEIVSKLSQINSNGLLLQEAFISSSSSTGTSDSAESLTKQHQLNILDKYRKFILETCNFRGAQILMNIKKKQILNRKCNVSHINTPPAVNSQTNGLIKSSKLKQFTNKSKKQNRIIKSKYLTPTPLVCTPISDNSSGTTSPSSSSVSPASSLSSSSYNNNDKVTPAIAIIQTPISTSSSQASTPASSILIMAQTPNPANDYSIQFNDLNERLFSCLLSNFSCQLVDQFLATQFHTGFVRKHKQNKSFTFVNIRNNLNESELMNESSGSNATGSDKINRLDLNVDKQTIQLCLKLNKWPQTYQNNYFNRKRINTKWPSKQVLDYINNKTCLITNDDTEWKLDTKLAESYLFKSLSKQKQFQYHYLYYIFMNLTIQLSNDTKQLLDNELHNKSSKLSMFQLINERVFKHHFFRFVELENEDESTNKQANQCFINLVNLTKKFSNYIRFLLEKYKTFNAPNYFDLNKSILNEHDYSILLSRNINNSNEDNDLPTCLFKLINSDLIAALNQFDSILNTSLINKLTNKKSSLQHNISLFNAFLDINQIRVGSNDWDLNANKCLLPAHYSADNYLYEYVYEFVAALFEQFKSKRDNFKISEQLMLELHDSILASKRLFEDNEDDDSMSENRFLNAIQHLNRDCLFDKFEEYAECVHKYLPQIRHNNQYLLFHYIWTMQVQYMAPFFNYLCDFYSVID